MKKKYVVLNVVTLLLLYSCAKDPVKEFKIESVISSADKSEIKSYLKDFRSVDSKNLEILQALSLSEQIIALVKNKELSKGDKLKALSLKENAKYFLKSKLSDDIKKSLSEDVHSLDQALNGKKVEVRNGEYGLPKAHFDNFYKLVDTKNPTRVSVDLNSKLSEFSTLKTFFTNETNRYNCTGISLQNPDPLGGSVSATDFLTRRTQEIQALAAELSSPEAIYEYVRDEISHLTKFGGTQSAHQVAISRTGTFIDKSTLLISLLRAQGIAAQYILGDVLVEEDKLKGIWGVEGKYDLYWALSSSLYNYWEQPTKGTIFNQDGKRTWLIPHGWVRAYISGQWIELDPSNISYEYGIQSPVFRNFNPYIDFKKYLSGKNANNQYEKAGTISDFVLESISDQIRSTFGKGASLRDLDLTKFGKVVTQDSENLPVGTMGYEGEGCPFHQENMLPISFMPTFELKMKKNGSQVFQSSWAVAEIQEKGLYTIHSAGLLGRVGNQPGNLQIFLADSEIGSVSARTIDKVDLSYSIQRGPTAYLPYASYGLDIYSIQSAGDPYAFMAYHSPVAERNLQDEMKKLKSLKASGASEAKRYAQFLRISNVLVLLQSFEQAKINNIINTTGSEGQGIFYTYSNGGILKDRLDRPLGAVPLGTGINWLVGNKAFSRTGNFTDPSKYTNIVDHNLMNILIGSQIEANTWEMLFGVPGGSATKLYQLMSKDIFQGSKPNNLVAGEILGVGRDSQIIAQFDDNMIRSVTFAINFDPSATTYKSSLYSHKNLYSRPNGFVGASVLILPNDPRAGAAAIYSGSSPALDILSPRGGGTTAQEVGQIAQPDDLDPNDPNRPGSQASCNPVSFATGDMFHDFLDFKVKGRTPVTHLYFERKYTTKPYKVLGDLGSNWTHNYQTRLISNGYDILHPEILTDIVWINEGGNKVVFTRNQNGTFRAPYGYKETLTSHANFFKLTRAEGHTYEFAKNHSDVPNGRLSSIKSLHGDEVVFDYDSAGKLTTVEAPFAGSITFNYNSSGKITSVHRDRDNLTYTFDYYPNGKLMESRDFSNQTTVYNYVSDRPGTAAQGLMNKIVNPLGHEIKFDYYDDGRVFEEVGRGDAKVTYFYSNYLVDHITRVETENGSTNIFKFDSDYRVIEVQHEDGSQLKYQWDPNSYLASETDELGYVTEYEHDSRGNRIRIKLPEHPSYVTAQYHPTLNRPTKVTPLLGAIQQNIWDDVTGDLIKTERRGAQITQFLEFDRDSFGNVSALTNNSATYSHQRNGDGFLEVEYDARNPVTYTWDSRGRVSTQAYANGKNVSFGYDNFDRITSITNSHGPDLINSYDALGRLRFRTITDGATSRISEYQYDSRDRVVRIIDPLNRQTVLKYDVPGLGCKYVIDQPVEIVRADGKKTKFQFDSRNRMTMKVDPNGVMTRSEYNERGDLIALTDGNGNRSTFSFDGNRRMIRSETTTAASSDRGVLRGTKEIKVFKYDLADRVIRIEKFSSLSLAETEVSKLVTEYQYNDFGQITKKLEVRELGVDRDELSEETYQYENLLDNPVLKSANNENVKLSFSFETTPPFSMISYNVSPTDPSNPLGFLTGEFTVTPDLTGQIGTLSGPSQANPFLENSYDSEGRLTHKVATLGTNELSSTLGYDSYGRKSSVTHSTGLNGIFGFDELDRIKTVSWSGAGEVFTEALTYNTNIDTISKIERELGILDFTYDSTDQLKTVQYSGPMPLGPSLNRTLAYDLIGNRVDDTLTGVGSFVRSVISEDQQFKYYADQGGMGQIIQKTNKSTKEQHVFDYLNDGRIRKFTKYEQMPNSTKTMEVDYFFDALGRRISKKVWDRGIEFTQHYLYQGSEDKILLAKNGSGEIQLQVDGQGIDEHLGHISSSGARTYVTDHLGTVSNGEALGDKKITGAFGEVLGTVRPLDQFSNPVIYGFTGRQLDSENMLYYYRNRSYDPHSGRFMSMDPIGFEGGDVNLYRYVGNDSVKYSDPLGLDREDIFVFSGTIPHSVTRIYDPQNPGNDVYVEFGTIEDMSKMEAFVRTSYGQVNISSQRPDYFEVKSTKIRTSPAETRRLLQSAMNSKDQAEIGNLRYRAGDFNLNDKNERGRKVSNCFGFSQGL